MSPSSSSGSSRNSFISGPTLLARGERSTDQGVNSALRPAGNESGGLRLAQGEAAGDNYSALESTYIEALLDGDRRTARKLIDNAIAGGASAKALLAELIWPVMEKLQGDYKADSLSFVQLSLATRLNRFVADYLGSKLEQAPMNGRRVVVFCGNDEPEELGGQITADLFQSAGYEVKFAGGGVPHDEVLELVGDYRPNLLVMFATLPSAVPDVRKLIDYLRDVSSNPEMQVMCCGGIYKRAAGLAEEIGADLYADDGVSAVEVASSHQGRRATADQQTVGRSRRVRKAAQRRAPVLGRIAPRPETDFEDRAEAV